MRKADYFAPTVRPNISGCVQFQGEDLGEEERIRANQRANKEALSMQIEENNQKRNFEKRQDFLYDQQRLAVTRAVDENQRNFAQQTYDVNKDLQQTNKQLEADRKQREKEEREAEIARDKAELQWTNDTQLKFSSSKSFADKYLN